jgi:hypothetical protein
MGSCLFAAEPSPVIRQPTQAEAWLEEATHQLAEHHCQDLAKLSELLRQGCFNCSSF